MRNRHPSRYLAAGLLATGLLVLSAATVMAHQGPGGPGHWPPLMPSAKASSSHGPVASHSPRIKSIDCTTLPTAAPSNGTTADSIQGGKIVRNPVPWGWRMGDGWLKDLDPARLKACLPKTLVKGVDTRIADLVATLGDARKLVPGIAGLDAAGQATLDAEIDATVADLQALKARIDAETNGATNAELKSLQTESIVVRAIVLQVRLIKLDEATLAKLPDLRARATDLAARIATAPAGANTDAARKLLDDMNARIADADKLVGPLPATLLGLTQAQLQAGKADPVLGAAAKASWTGSFDVWKAGHDAAIIGWLLALPKAA